MHRAITLRCIGGQLSIPMNFGGLFGPSPRSRGFAGEVICDDPDRLPGCQWFPQAQLNYAENLLRFDDDVEALVEIDEGDARRSLTYRQLREEVAALAHWMEGRGIQPGDRVAGFMPNCIETVIAMLATSSLGAVWSSCSPDFGIQGAVDRFGQIAPRILFSADGYRYNGKACDSLERASQIADAIPAIEAVVVVPKLSQHRIFRDPSMRCCGQSV
jgi:acetoacetyl-CoA synthetase